MDVRRCTQRRKSLPAVNCIISRRTPCALAGSDEVTNCRTRESMVVWIFVPPELLSQGEIRKLTVSIEHRRSCVKDVPRPLTVVRYTDTLDDNRRMMS